MRIAILQLNALIGDVDKNLARVKGEIQAHPGIDLFITPEQALIGYPARDLLGQTALIQREQNALEELQQLSADLKVGILVGHAEKRPDLSERPLFNSASLFDRGILMGQVRKQRLPAYNIFEEERFFANWKDGPQEPILFRDRRLHVSICEDGWSRVKGFGIRDFRTYPDLFEPAGVWDLNINLSASPYSLSKRAAREKTFSTQASLSNRPLIYANSAGAQDDILFDGASFACDNTGLIVAQAKIFQEETLVLDWNLDKNSLSPVKPDQSAKPHQAWQELHAALVCGIKDFVTKCGSSKVVLGLSGGIDSTLCAALAAAALGAENVLGVSLPSAVTSEQSKRLARETAETLGISFREISIASMVAEHSKVLELPEKGVAFENLQSRNRGLALMTIANQENRLLLATGNKSELAMGYATLYGDMAGALCPLGDLYKTEVFGLSHFINSHSKGSPPVSLEVLKRAPTAELAVDQKDNDTLPYYEILDGILFELIENQGNTIYPEATWNKLLAPRHTVDGLRKKLFSQEFKRHQTAPVLRVHARSFGSGWHMPIAKGYP